MGYEAALAARLRTSKTLHRCLSRPSMPFHVTPVLGPTFGHWWTEGETMGKGLINLAACFRRA